MSKQWVRQEIQKNAIADYTGVALSWVQENREKVLGIGGAVLAAAILGGLFIYRTFQGRTDAWERLAVAQSYAYQGQAGQALEQINALQLQARRTPAAGFGMLFAGDVLYRAGKYREAADTYQKILDEGVPKSLFPFALGNLGLTQEAAGDCRRAAATGQQFLDAYQDHFLAPPVHASLARCIETLGDKEKAKAAYERISLLYPDTPWAQWAQARLKPS
ncbi:MAG: tetratricopeptide repeat protein [Elusimicrobia bacterium]|nr:tetratricopeptide repeat protein [Elusimicrobiota bacterium]